jgi:hypothetical protein
MGFQLMRIVWCNSEMDGNQMRGIFARVADYTNSYQRRSRHTKRWKGSRLKEAGSRLQDKQHKTRMKLKQRPGSRHGIITIASIDVGCVLPGDVDVSCRAVDVLPSDMQFPLLFEAAFVKPDYLVVRADQCLNEELG